MSPTPRRALTIDDPVGGREACHVAHPPESGETDGGLRQIAVQDIHPNPDQPRKRFDEVTLSFLADSIRERGVLQPIIVRPIAANGFELVAGERRWRAAQLAGLSTIPALVDANAEGAGSLELALIENVAREDLTPIEEARTIAVLLHDLKVTATVLAKRLGRSRTDLAGWRSAPRPVPAEESCPPTQRSRAAAAAHRVSGCTPSATALPGTRPCEPEHEEL